MNAILLPPTIWCLVLQLTQVIVELLKLRDVFVFAPKSASNEVLTSLPSALHGEKVAYWRNITIQATNKVWHCHRADILVLNSIISADPVGENCSNTVNGLLLLFCQELLGSVGSTVAGRGAALLKSCLLGVDGADRVVVLVRCVVESRCRRSLLLSLAGLRGYPNSCI